MIAYCFANPSLWPFHIFLSKPSNTALTLEACGQAAGHFPRLGPGRDY